MKRFLFWTGVCLATIAFLIVCGLAWLGYSINKSLEPEIDPRLYGEIVNVRAKASSKYAFFPRTIDPAAEQVAFFHVPGFLQGADIVCLRLRLPEKNFTQVLDGLEASGRAEIHGFGDLPKPQWYPTFELSKPNHKNMMAGVAELPADFRIFLFECSLENIKTNWNHNFMVFTAVSLKRSEVVYYADHW